MALKSFIDKSINRIKEIERLFNLENLNISYDKLKNGTKTDFEIIYYNNKNNKNTNEGELIFIFGFNYFLKELGEQEFKKKLNQDYLDFLIYRAYFDLKKQKTENKEKTKIKISEILNKIQNKEKDSLELHKILEKIFTQAYYLDWKIEPDQNAVEKDYFIEIPNTFLIKLKQRFNLDIIEHIYENENIFLFLNAKNKLILVFKQLDQFTKKDLEKYTFETIKKLFNIKKITETK